MNTFALADSGYLSAVASSRCLARQRAKAIASQLDTPTAALEFMLSFLGLRVGPLHAIAHWLEISADACEALHPEIAEELRELASIERADQRALLDDLRELDEFIGVSAPQIQAPADPRITRHATIRGLVPTRSEPLIVLAIDLELAELGRALGPALLGACRRALAPHVDGCRFIRARVCTFELGVIHRRTRELLVSPNLSE